MKSSLSPRRPLMAAILAAGLCSGGMLTPGAAAHAAERLNCVQYVKRISPVALSGDAYKWWDNAEGLYGRGRHPQPGAVMVFAKTHHLPYGHVAVVRSVRDKRTVLVDHANWSVIHGHRGQVERSVAVVDVSPHNDWSQVKVWYHPTADIGQTPYAVRGFVYPRQEPHHHMR